MEGNKANLLPLTNKNGKALSLICSLVTPCGFIVEQTIWNSFKFLCGSLLVKPWKVGNKWIKPNFNSKATLIFGNLMHKGC